MFVIVTYDVSTESPAGRRRLRRVAKVCVSVGQRVQKSVFECRINAMQFEEFERRLLEEVDLSEDNLRFYRLTDAQACQVKEYGVFRATDFTGPLVA